MVMNGIPFSNVACGGSVACSAFSLVYKLGFSRIILVGQDLALTDNKTHADGTFKEKMDVIDTRYCQWYLEIAKKWCQHGLIIKCI